MSSSPSVQIRKGRATDVPFVISSWLKSYNAWLKPVEREAGYWQAHKYVIAALLERATLYIAASDHNDDIIYGWACLEDGDPAVIHYVYVKAPYRRAGIARSLLEPHCNGSVVMTHVTKPELLRLAKSMGWGLATAAPYYHAIMRSENEGAEAGSDPSA